jgi:hypothetical protein
MLQRTSNPNNPDASRYRDKGIRVCPEWRDFRSFLEDAYRLGYDDNMEIHRVDNKGDYTPENVAFLTTSEHDAAHAWLRAGNHGLPPALQARYEARRAKQWGVIQQARAMFADFMARR